MLEITHYKDYLSKKENFAWKARCTRLDPQIPVSKLREKEKKTTGCAKIDLQIHYFVRFHRD